MILSAAPSPCCVCGHLSSNGQCALKQATVPLMGKSAAQKRRFARSPRATQALARAVRLMHAAP